MLIGICQKVRLRDVPTPLQHHHLEQQWTRAGGASTIWGISKANRSTLLWCSAALRGAAAVCRQALKY